MKKFSTHWKSSKKPRKQRKYLVNAPLHIRKDFISSHLSKELRKKFKTRNIPLRKGDRVKIMRGEFKGKIGKVTDVDKKEIKVFIEGIETVKKDGSKSSFPLHPSNLLITELNLDDKYRKEKIQKFEIKK